MEVFGCCSSYMECSKAGKCIHPVDPDYEGCQYNKNLLAGKNYYSEEETTMEIKIVIENLPELIEALKALAPVKAAVAETVAPAQKKTATTKAAVAETVAPATVAPAVVEEDDMFGSVEVYTFDDVKAKLAKLSQTGKQAEVKALIVSYNVTKLSEIPEDKFSEVMKKAEAIG